MSFENIDLQKVLDEVAESGLSVSQAGDSLSPEQIAEYRDIVDSHDGTLGVIIVDGPPDGPTGLRNLAESVKDAGGDDQAVPDLSTVIVRAPYSSQVVSDGLTRYQIESNQSDLSGSLAPGDVDTFLQTSESAAPDFTALNSVVLVCIVLAVVLAAGAAHLMYRARH